MRIGLLLGFFGLIGCTQTGPSAIDDKPPVSPTQPEVGPEDQPTADPEADPEADPTSDPPADPKTAAITVQMTSATLADDCGGGPSTPPQIRKEKRSVAKGDVFKGGGMAKGAKGDRGCEQSSIQLAITAPADAKATAMTVKSVELFAESGALIGQLQARAPSVWSDEGGYVPWNENVEPAQDLSVSYAVAQPDWSQVEDRWNQTYTVKAVLSIAGTDQTVEQSVEVDAPTSLPPNVKT